METESVRFAAIIGHADDPDLLRSCIDHHLRIGVERIFVSLNDSDPRSAEVVQEFGAQDRVRGAKPEAFAVDPFEFFTAAVDVVRHWCAPQWLILLDTDEFWIPADDQINRLRNLEHYDLLRVSRFNAPVLRADGRVFARLPPDKASFVYGDPSGSYLELREIGASWAHTRVAPKIMVRPELVARIGRGAHAAVGHEKPFRDGEPDDVLIVHLPFTSRERFARKLAAIRKRLRDYGAKFRPDEAAHWRDWMLLATEQVIDDEFNKQVVDEREIERLVSTGALTTPEKIFERRQASANDTADVAADFDP
jgi:hypothetical protein